MARRELTTLTDVASAADHDPLLVWAAQGMRAGVRAWTAGDAVAVASPDLARRHRLAVLGPPGAVATLVRHALAEVGDSYRPIGDAALIAAIQPLVDGLQVRSEFGWMTTGDRPGENPTHPPVGWLPPEAAGEIECLLGADFPESYARPGRAGVLGWAGARDAAGRLAAVGAEAWSAPGDRPRTGVGFIAGVATRLGARQAGYATAVCGFLVNALADHYGRAALMVDSWNVPAVRLYRRLGFGWRSVAAARLVTAASETSG